MYRLLHIITDTNVGGAGVLLLCQLKYIDKKRFSVTVALPEGSQLIPRVRELGVAVAETRRGGDRSSDAAAVLEYAAVIRALRPHVVHCHGSLAGRVAAKLCRVPVRVHTRHCAYPPSFVWRHPPLRWLAGSVNNILSDAIVAVAEAAKDDLVALGTDEGRIRVIINGAEPLELLSDEERRAVRLALGFGADDFVVGMFARLEPCKGHRYLFEAMAELGRDSRVKALICGGGSLECQLKRLVARLGVADRVVFAGFCPDVTPYMNAVDVNVNCSVGTETSSLALSEGMSIGRVAVVSDYGGNGAMVEDGVSGIVVPRADPTALAAALRRLEGDGELVARMSGASVRRYRERFTPQRMTKSMEDLYLELLAVARRKKRAEAEL